MRKAQAQFFETNWQTRYAGGGQLRNLRAGRKARPLSTKDSVHLVFKASSPRAGFRTPRRFLLISRTIEKYAKKFFVKVESFSIQHDHIHLSIRATKRTQYQNFFRVAAGQIAQKLRASTTSEDPEDKSNKKTSFWKSRPYTRVIKGQKAWAIVRDYIRLNEKEAQGEIPYRKSRLRGLLPAEWETFWS